MNNNLLAEFSIRAASQRNKVISHIRIKNAILSSGTTLLCLPGVSFATVNLNTYSYKETPLPRQTQHSQSSKNTNDRYPMHIDRVYHRKKIHLSITLCIQRKLILHGVRGPCLRERHENSRDRTMRLSAFCSFLSNPRRSFGRAFTVNIFFPHNAQE